MDKRNRKLKILVIHTRYLHERGGEDTVVEAEIELLRSHGHAVDLLVFDNGTMKSGIKGKIVAGLSAVYNPISRKKLANAITNFKPDIIHVHNFFFTASPSIFFEAKLRKVPIVVTLHNFRLICVNALLLRNNIICERCVHHSFPWDGVRFKCYHGSSVQSMMVGAMGAIHKWLGTWQKKVNAILTPSSFIRARMIDSSLKPSPEKIFVKHNFLSDPGFVPGNARGDYFLFVGRISEEKGVNILLEAWKEMEQQHLIITGEGPQLNELINQYGHLPNVQFTGIKPRQEVLQLMKGCKALIFPSIWYEGLPMTLVESLATGTPVIASGIGAMKEMLTERRNGMLFPTGDAKGLSEKVEEFLQLLKKDDFSLYEGARNSYLENYEPEKCYDAIMRIYTNILEVAHND